MAFNIGVSRVVRRTGPYPSRRKMYDGQVGGGLGSAIYSVLSNFIPKAAGAAKKIMENEIVKNAGTNFIAGAAAPVAQNIINAIAGGTNVNDAAKDSLATMKSAAIVSLEHAKGEIATALKGCVKKKHKVVTLTTSKSKKRKNQNSAAASKAKRKHRHAPTMFHHFL
jgi:hypothetical protein